jgi:hypothetical protein
MDNLSSKQLTNHKRSSCHTRSFAITDGGRHIFSAYLDRVYLLTKDFSVVYN